VSTLGEWDDVITNGGEGAPAVSFALLAEGMRAEQLGAQGLQSAATRTGRRRLGQLPPWLPAMVDTGQPAAHRTGPRRGYRHQPSFSAHARSRYHARAGREA